MQAIGKLIEKKLREKGMSVSEFARRINTNRNNVYDIFERKSVDTSLLQKIGRVLDTNFFSFYISSSKEYAFNEDGEIYRKADPAYRQALEDIENLRRENSELKEKLELLKKINDLLEEKVAGRKK